MSKKFVGINLDIKEDLYNLEQYLSWINNEIQENIYEEMPDLLEQRIGLLENVTHRLRTCYNKRKYE